VKTPGLRIALAPGVPAPAARPWLLVPHNPVHSRPPARLCSGALPGPAASAVTIWEDSMSEQHAPLADGSRGMKLSRAGRRLTRVLTGTHRSLLAAAGGRVLGRMGGHPLLILTTTGRRTGRPFSTPVIGIADGDDYLVVASNGGAATQPMWVRNIAANPRVTIRRGTLSQHCQARFLTSAERAQWWPRLTAAYKPYATMQARTDRELPVLRLSAATPAAGSSPPTA
jgi:deazaflavin-dependent oxidoreductase (nitroreductase family)